jgi:SAM-dependent methyltransferase
MKLTHRDFELLWNTSLMPIAINEINKMEYEYENLTKAEEIEIITEIHREILENKFVKAGQDRQTSWEKGWDENLKNFKRTENINELVPKYFGKSNINRLGQHLIRSTSKNFDLNMLRAIQARVFSEYLTKAKNIYEFGCGTGHNLLFLSRFNLEASLVGLDWAKSSQEILQLLNKTQVKNIVGKRFDYFSPDDEFKLVPSSAVLTIASLEQIGNKHKPFIDYLLKNQPSIVIHVEPFRDLLDDQNPIDLASIEYMKQRNYIEGYCQEILDLQNNNRARVHLFERSFIGSKYVDGYTIMVWSPTQ